MRDGRRGTQRGRRADRQPQSSHRCFLCVMIDGGFERGFFESSAAIQKLFPRHMDFTFGASLREQRPDLCANKVRALTSPR